VLNNVKKISTKNILKNFVIRVKKSKNIFSIFLRNIIAESYKFSTVNGLRCRVNRPLRI
jgi:hypothetical protein